MSLVNHTEYQQLFFNFDEDPPYLEDVHQVKELAQPWSEEEIAHLRDKFLHQTLRILADGRVGNESKRKAMEWLLSDEIAPFSFVVCCHEMGVSPNDIRESVLLILNQIDKPTGRLN